MSAAAEIVGFLMTDFGFWAHKKHQEKIWGNRDLWDAEPTEAYPIDGWISMSCEGWGRIRGNLPNTQLVRDIDAFHERLIGYRKSMQVFLPDSGYRFHRRILNDPKWHKIQNDAMELFLRGVNSPD